MREVLIRKWEAGDWYELFVDGVEQGLCSGHSIQDDEWIALLERAGVNVTVEMVPSDDETD